MFCAHSQSVMHYAVKDYDGEKEPRISTRTTVAVKPIFAFFSFPFLPMESL